MTAVFVPETSARSARSDVAPAAAAPAARPETTTDGAAPAARARRDTVFRAAGGAQGAPTADVPRAGEPADGSTPAATVEGYVLFRVGGTTFAVSVGEVREIVRAARIDLLPLAESAYGHGIALVDARGRSIPVLDLRSARSTTGDVLLPMWRHQVGLVVDRVTSVQTPRELVPEHDQVPAALPSYARGVLRPVEGGAPVLLIAMPDAAELERDAARTDEPRLGEDVLAEPTPAGPSSA